MESEKPRGISILAAGAVDLEKPRGIAIPAARVVAADAFLLTRNLSGTFSSAGSVPIRAPLTVDDDDDDSGSVTDQRNVSSSDASSYSKGLDSGTDDGFESLSGEADDETELEDVIMDGIRVLGEEMVGEIGDGSDFSGGSVIFRPFGGDIEEETLLNYSSLEEGSEISDEVDGISESEVSDTDGVSMKAKVVIPRAVLSLDDEEFDEILGSSDEEAALLRVTKAPGDEEAKVEDRTLQFGNMGMVESPECSDSLIGDVLFIEEEAVEMKDSDKLEDGLISFRNIEDLSLGVPLGGSKDFIGENEGNSIEASTSLDGSSKQIIEKEVIQGNIIKDDGGGSIHEVNASMQRGDVEGVVDSTVGSGEMGMTDKPECSSSVTDELVSTEEYMVQVRKNNLELEDNLVSFRNFEDLSVDVLPGGFNDFMVENERNSIEGSIGLDGISKHLIGKGVVQRSIIKDDGGCSIHEVSALMKPGDLEGVEDSAVGLGEMRKTDKSESSGSVTGELLSAEKDLQVDDGLASFKIIEGLGVVPGDCNEFLVEGEGNAVDADRGLDETFCQLFEQGSISKDNENMIYYGNSCEAHESMVSGEGSIELRRRDSGDGSTRNMIGEAKERSENACGALTESEKTECEGKPEIGMSSDSFQVTPSLDYVTMRNLENAGGTDLVVSGCGSLNQKAEQEAKNESKQESKDIDRKLSHHYEDRASNLSSFETANESVENGEQISEQVNKQVNLLSVKDVEITMTENSCVTGNYEMEAETHMGRLINSHTCMEFDGYKEKGDTKEKLSESTIHKYSEKLSSDHSVQLISEKVKERVEKTKILKEKLQRIIRRIDLCSENSAVTEVKSQLSLVGGEHQTSLRRDHVSDRTKIMLPEQEFPDDLDLCINILVIGKTGVGKSATINSIFGETKSPVGAFGVTTNSTNYVVGNVGGILIRILDTPGLMSAATEERFNQEVLTSIKKSMRTFPVDVILYIDRLDENPDTHLLGTITNSLGSSIWRNAIVVLTHAASDVPDSSSYKDLIAQRSSLTHQSIRQAVPKLRCVDQSKMPEIVLAENNMNSFCGNKTIESTCQDWRLNLLILCCSVKIRPKAGSLPKQNTVVEKPDAFDSPLRSFTLFCSLWNVLLLGAKPGQASNSLDDLEVKKRQSLDRYPEILWDEQNQECLERETLPVKYQEPEDEERRNEKEKRNTSLEKGIVLGRVRARRGRLGFQATKRFGIYLDTSDLHTGFSIGDYRKQEEEEKTLVRVRSSMAVLGLVHNVCINFCLWSKERYLH